MAKLNPEIIGSISTYTNSDLELLEKLFKNLPKTNVLINPTQALNNAFSESKNKGLKLIVLTNASTVNLPDFKDLSVKKLAFIKDGIDAYLEGNNQNPREFFGAYKEYLSNLKEGGTIAFKYEDFIKQPRKVTFEICKELELAYEDVIEKAFTDKLNIFKYTKRRDIDQTTINSINNCPEMHLSQAEYGYPAIFDKEFHLDDQTKFRNKFKKAFKQSLVSLNIDPEKNGTELRNLFVKDWMEDLGDKKLRLEYEGIDNNSTIFDLGGYEGEWAEEIYNYYQPNIYVFEPVVEFADNISNYFKNNSKVKVHPFGLAEKDMELNITLDENKSSVFTDDTTEHASTNIKLKSFKEFIETNQIEKIDLIKINIEGGEYGLLQSMLEHSLMGKVKNLQVQFHTFVDGFNGKYKKIVQGLSQTHRRTYYYPFVWENWELK